MIKYLREWKEDTEFGSWSIQSENGRPKTLACVAQGVNRETDRPEGYFAGFFTTDKKVILSPNFPERDDAMLWAELMLELNRTQEQWQQCYCDQWHKNHGLTHLSSEWLLENLIQGYLQDFPRSPINDFLLEKLEVYNQVPF